MSKSESLTEDLARAVERLDDACRRLAAAPSEDELLRDGLIQRFRSRPEHPRP